MRLSTVLPGIVAAAVLLVACAPATPDWTAKGKSPAETEAAWAACKEYASQRAGTGFSVGGAAGGVNAMATDGGGNDRTLYERRATADTYRRAVEACMRGKGYYPVRSK